MCKCWWRLEKYKGLWKDFMWRKYLHNSCVSFASQNKKDSALWKDMLHIRDIYLSGRKMAVGLAKEHISGEIPGVVLHV
jgi:hypothetical protein